MMKKRKILIQKNSKHKESIARPSVASLRSVATSHQRRSRSAKSPSIQNLHDSNSSDKFARFKDEHMVLPDEMQPPKTKFDSSNRSKEACSLPRLKNFPAEEIKKFDNPPMFSPEPIAALIMQQDPRETGTFYTNSSSKNNNGQGDAISVQLSPHRRSKSQNTCNTSQQQVVANHREICQTNPHSESLLTRRLASPERQVHRPFVPNVHQGTVYDRSLRSSSAIINQPVLTQIPSTQVAMPQTQGCSLNNSHAVVNQSSNESSVLNSQCQKQLVNDRNAANHRQMFMQMQQQKQATTAQNASVPLNDQTAGNCQNIYHNQFHAPFQQNLHQINQQTQHSAYRQMLPQALNQMQPISNQQQHIYNNSGAHCSHYKQLPVAQFSLGQGMTSPQDMTVNQMRLMRHNLPNHQQNLRYPVNFQPAWPQNDKRMQITSPNQQQFHQQSPSQWQYYYQAPDTNFNQQNSGSQDRSNSSQNQANHKSINQPITEAHTEREGKKRLQFTSDMIRDQELLLSTMRQQGVPEEVMRRQFDSLLNEQKRHLAYAAQFQQQAIPEEIKRTQVVRRRTEKDEKPEWMVHITPPRISYNDIERMKAQQRALNEQYLIDDKSPEKINKIVTEQQKNDHQSKKEEICNQVSPQQIYVQVNPYQLWQAPNWPHRSDHQASCGRTACCPYNHQQNASNDVCRPLNPTFKYVQHPYNMRYNPYFPHSESQEVCSFKEHNPNSLNSIDNQRTSMDPAYFYQQNKRPIETSSLLKMRVYKEIICPQKRNNGLQDPDSIQKMLEALKDPTSRKGLEYLANLSKKKPIVRLNGVQNSNEIPEDVRPRPFTEIPLQSQKKNSSNGLENSRNPNNPPTRFLRLKRADEPLMTEYPRQRQNTRNCYSMQAERENGTVATLQNQGALSHAQDAYGSIPYDRQNIMQGYHHGNNDINLQYGESAPPQHYYQMQQYCLNRQNLPGRNDGQGDVACMQRPDVPGAMRIDRAGGDTGEKPNAKEAAKRIGGVQAMQGTNAYGQPEIRETRTIGGITYLARKPECALNNLVVSPDKLIASEHVQAPRIV